MNFEERHCAGGSTAEESCGGLQSKIMDTEECSFGLEEHQCAGGGTNEKGCGGLQYKTMDSGDYSFNFEDYIGGSAAEQSCRELQNESKTIDFIGGDLKLEEYQCAGGNMAQENYRGLQRESKTMDSEECSFNFEEQQCADGGRVEESNVTSDHRGKSETNLKSYDHLTICPEHEKHFEFFCKDHNAIFCSTCAVTGHQRCKVSSLKEKAKSVNISFDLIHETIDVLRHGADRVKTVEFEESDFQDKENELMEQIDALGNIFDGILYGLSEKLCVQAEHACLTERGHFSEKIRMLEREIKPKLEKYRDVIFRVILHGSREQKFIAMQSIRQQIASYKSILRQLMTSLYRQEFSIAYSRPLRDILSSEEDIASLSINKRNVDSGTHSEERATALKLITSVQNKHDSGVTKVSYNRVDTDFFPDGKLAIFDKDNGHLKIMSDNLQKLGMYKPETAPRGYCFLFVLSDDELAIVTRDRKLDFLHVSKTNDVTLTRTVSTETSRESVCLMNETKLVIAKYNWSATVKMVSATDQQVDLRNFLLELSRERKTLWFCHQGNDIDDYYINRSFVYVRTGDKIVFACTSYPYVHLYYYKQEVIGKRYVKLWDPSYICVGPERCFYVYTGVNSVALMTHTGKAITAHNLGLKGVRSMCVSKTRKRLVISDEENFYMYDIVQ